MDLNSTGRFAASFARRHDQRQPRIVAIGRHHRQRVERPQRVPTPTSPPRSRPPAGSATRHLSPGAGRRPLRWRPCRHRNAGALVEDVVVVLLDPLEDPGVEDVGRRRRTAPMPVAAWRCRCRPIRTARGSGRSRTSSARATRRRRDAAWDRRRIDGGLPAACTHARDRRSSPTSRRKLVSWNARPEISSMWQRLRRARLEDGQHHLADHRGRAVHVDEQIVPGLVLADRQVHRHRCEEPAEHIGIVSERAHGVDDGLEHDVVGAAGGRDRAKKRSPKSASALARTSAATSPRSSTMSSA